MSLMPETVGGAPSTAHRDLNESIPYGRPLSVDTNTNIMRSRNRHTNDYLTRSRMARPCRTAGGLWPSLVPYGYRGIPGIPFFISCQRQSKTLLAGSFSKSVCARTTSSPGRGLSAMRHLLQPVIHLSAVDKAVQLHGLRDLPAGGL
jgi:hypothetical protein